MKNPYTYPDRSRVAKVNYICGIGGYFDRNERWPIEFNVATYDADLEFDALYTTVFADHAAGFDDSPQFKEACRTAYEEHNQYLWEWAQEDCYDSLTDDDTYRMLWDGTSLDVELQLRGRGGKHLVIERFEGVRLAGYTDTALQEALMLQSNGYEETFEPDRLKKGYEWELSQDYVDKLYKYCRQCAVDFTIKKAGMALQSAAAWHLCTRGESEMEAQQARLEDKEALQGSAKLLYDLIPYTEGELVDAWRDLCLAAGLSPSDIMY